MDKKDMKQEDFPVGMLIDKNKQLVVEAYYLAAREADNIADNISITCTEKLEALEKIEQEFFLAKSKSNSAKLGQLFRQENLDSSLYTDLFVAFRKDCNDFKPQIWEQLLDYCRYSAAPVGRFVLALHDETPTSYLPAEGLCAVLQIINMLKDIKFDVCKLRRCYIPQELLSEFSVYETDFCLLKSTIQVKKLITSIAQRLEAMLADAKILIPLIKNRRLRAEVCVIFSLTNCMLKKIKKGDVIAQKIRLNKFDWIKALIIGCCQSVFIRTKTCHIIR